MRQERSEQKKCFVIPNREKQMSDAPSSEIKIIPIDPSLLGHSEKLDLLIGMLREQSLEIKDIKDKVRRIETSLKLVYNEVSSHGKRLGELGDTFNEHCDIIQKMLDDDDGEEDGDTADSA